MRTLTVGLINIDQAGLTTAMMERLAQLPRDRWTVQMVVVDNGSEERDLDEMRAWLADNKARFGDTVWIEAGENLGASAGRNVILDRAEGKRILILDNDLVLDDNDAWLETLWQDLDDDERLAVAGPMLVFAAHPHVVQAAGIGLTRLGRVGYLHRGELAESVPSDAVLVEASPAACWLMRADVQRRVGPLPEIYYPMQYWDVDYCMSLGAAGYGVLCDRRVRVKHIANLTTRSHGDHVFARTAVRHGILFRERWHDRLGEIDTIEDSDIYWGPIPKP